MDFQTAAITLKRELREVKALKFFLLKMKKTCQSRMQT